MVRESAELRKLIEPAVTALGFELVGVEFIHGKRSLLRVYIDHEDGIGVDDCKSVSYQVSGLLDVEDPIRGQYTLEVSYLGYDKEIFTGLIIEEHYKTKIIDFYLLQPEWAKNIGCPIIKAD